jgi:nucleotide-binding universal stress UspA family protein
VSGEAVMATDPASNVTGTDQTHRIVVGIDGSDGARRALEWAAAQARLTGALLEIARTVAPGAAITTKIVDLQPAGLSGGT